MRYKLTTTLFATLLGFAPLSSLFVASAQQRMQDRKLVVESIKQLPSEDKRFALVIGIDAYDDAQINRLRGGANDAKALAATLVQYAGFQDTNVVLLASDQPAQRKPTRRIILRYLANLRGHVPKDGLLFVFFAGHGIEYGGRGFLLPADAEGTDDISLLEETAISVERVKEAIRATGVRQVMLVLDACRNDPMANRSNGDNLMSASFSQSFNFGVRNREVNAFVTLYATSVGQRAYEYAEKEQGYFTYALVEAMRGGAANVEGEVTLSGLLSYVQDRVPRLVRRDLGASKVQRPDAVIEGYQANALVLAVSNRAVGNAIATLPPTPNRVEPTTPTNTAPTITVRKAQATTSDGIELMYIPAGVFRMGSMSTLPDEHPIHEVTIRNGFYMGKYEITQAQWQRVMGNNPSKFKGGSLPVETVSWDDAQRFIRKLNAKNGGYVYRLPTEAEWEYACRAGTTENYAGDLDALAWYGNERAGKTTHPVGTKQPNRFGLYDMHGNVWELCVDWYHANYTGAPVDGSAWLSGGEQRYRVLRGGSWVSDARRLRSAYRETAAPDDHNTNVGFRVVASPKI